MRSTRRVGAAVAAMAVLGLGLAACGGDDEPAAKETGQSIDELNDELLSPGPEDDLLADDASDEPADEYPDTPKSEAFDAKAETEGLEVEGYAQPSEYVLMMCESMDAWEPGAGETLAKNHVPDMTDEEKQALREGAGSLCPKRAAEIRAALGGKAAVRTMSSGTYRIVKGAGLKEDVAPPGTYRTSGDLEDCYWERARKDGTILDNQFATAAKEIRVTVRAGELFTSRDCGTWSLAR